MKKLLWLGIPLGLLIVSIMNAGQQPPKTPPWDAWRFWLGEWVSEGDPAQGSGYYSLSPDLQGRLLVRKNHAEYAATKDRPAVVHDDLMVIYGEAEAGQKAIYWDNEGHVIEYAVNISPDRNSVIFISPVQAAAPRYRLTCSKLGQDQVRVTFEIAPPGKPEAFSMYLEGRARRKT
jgi:hypothetical protein